MNEILSDLHKPSWWFTVVVAALVVGVVGSIIASYTKSALDRASRWLASARSAAQESLERAVDVANSDQLLRIELYVRSISYRQQATRWMACAFLVGVPAMIGRVAGDWWLSIFGYISAALMFFAAIKWESLATQADKITDAVSARQRQLNDNE